MCQTSFSGFLANQKAAPPPDSPEPRLFPCDMTHGLAPHCRIACQYLIAKTRAEVRWAARQLIMCF